MLDPFYSYHYIIHHPHKIIFLTKKYNYFFPTTTTSPVPSRHHNTTVFSDQHNTLPPGDLNFYGEISTMVQNHRNMFKLDDDPRNYDPSLLMFSLLGFPFLEILL